MYSGRNGEKETWWLNQNVQEGRQGKRVVKKNWDTERRQECKEMCRGKCLSVKGQNSGILYADVYARLD